MDKGDRRMFTRYKVRINANIIAPRFFLSAEITEISLIGVRIHSLRALDPGTKITLCLDVEQSILFHGMVVWVLEDPDQYGVKYIVGIDTSLMEYDGHKAIGLAERSELFQEILCVIKEQAVSA